MFLRDVAPGIHMIQNHHVNCYLLEDSSGLTLVDAGLPRVWGGRCASSGGHRRTSGLSC